MKRYYQLALWFAPLLIIFALWLTRLAWWPYVQSLGVPLDQYGGRIQTIATAVGVLPLGIGLLLWYRSLLRPTPTSDPFSEENALQAVTPEQIRQDMGKGGQVNWIDRHATQAGDLQKYGRLAFVGRSRQGKTREAAELIRRAVALDQVSQTCLYQPGAAFRFLAESSLRTAILARVDHQHPVLFFVDDLPYHFPTAADLAKLDAALAAFNQCKATYVIATARDDQLSAEHLAWLERQQFQQLTLPDLSAEQTGRLVDNAAGLWQMQVNADARQALVEQNNGTPELPLMSLKLLRSEDVLQVDAAAAERVMRQTIADAWAEMRRAIVVRQPFAADVLDALMHFHAAGVNKYTPLVLAYAAQLGQQAKPKRAWWHRLHQGQALLTSLAYLRHFDITVRNNQIVHPDQVVEGAPTTVATQVGDFLLRYRWWLRHSWLRRLHRAREAQRWALFDLALACQNRQEHTEAVRYYTAAIVLEPHSWFYNNRGNARKAQGDLPGALADYAEAIRLNPAYADPYNNRGNARAAQGDLPGALADYAEAIRLNPADADPYNNRGNARAAQDDVPGALADYAEAIRLNPAYAIAYNNRGIARKAQGDLPGALADYAEAIRLNPAYAKVYYNRGNTRKAQGDLPGAIADYCKSLEMADQLPDKGRRVYRSLGSAYGQLERWAEAQVAYQQALTLAPDNLLDWISLATAARHCGDEATLQKALAQARRLMQEEDLYNRACLESVAGNEAQALDLLAQAVAADPEDKAQAQNDPDLFWVRTDARFAEIVGAKEEVDN